MVFYYIVRDVVRGADCSYKPGRTLLDCVQRDPHQARLLAEKYNRFCHVAGVCYLVVPHDDSQPFACDHFERMPIKEEIVYFN